MPTDCVNTERSPHYGIIQELVDSLFPSDDGLAAGGGLVAGDGSAAGDGCVSDDGCASDGSPISANSVPRVRRLDVIVRAELMDVPDDVLEIVNLLPPGDYTRAALTTQLNSSIGGHAWGLVYGTVS